MRKRNIVLASASPRRSELMHMLGLDAEGIAAKLQKLITEN